MVLEILTFLKVFGREFQNPVTEISKVPPSSDLQLKGAQTRFRFLWQQAPLNLYNILIDLA